MTGRTLLLLAALAIPSGHSTAAPRDWLGRPFPNLNVNFLDKAPKYSGTALLVEFWATWCPPCRESIPHLNALHQKYRSKGLVIIGISDEDPSAVTRFRKKTPISYSVACDPGGRFRQQFGITGIPQSFLVGKDGRIIWQGSPTQIPTDLITKALK